MPHSFGSIKASVMAIFSITIFRCPRCCSDPRALRFIQNRSMWNWIVFKPIWMSFMDTSVQNIRVRREKMDTLDAIRLRHSCRRYQQTDIRQYELDMLLQAAHAAPAACGRHDHLCLSVIQDQAFLEKWDHISAKYLNAPTLIHCMAHVRFF